MAIAVAIGVFGATSGEALAGVVGPLSKCPSSSAWSTCRSGPGRRYFPTTPEATTASSATSPPEVLTGGRRPLRLPPDAGRSQMNQVLFIQTAGDAHQALSAGTTPAEYGHPEVVQVIREHDIDLADRVPQLLRELAEQADVVVTNGAAATRARTYPASSTSTGSSPTRRARRSTPSGRSATRSRRASRRW